MYLVFLFSCCSSVTDKWVDFYWHYDVIVVVELYHILSQLILPTTARTWYELFIYLFSHFILITVMLDHFEPHGVLERSCDSKSHFVTQVDGLRLDSSAYEVIQRGVVAQFYFTEFPYSYIYAYMNTVQYMTYFKFEQNQPITSWPYIQYSSHRSDEINYCIINYDF